MYRLSILVLIAGLSPGCLPTASPGTESRPAQCDTTADCPSASVCDEGVCWGAPKDGARFAAVLTPPADRSDLAATEFTSLIINPDGTLPDLEFKPAVGVSVRVTLACIPDGPQLCDEASIAARLTFERTSRIPGGPMFRRTVETPNSLGEAERLFVALPPLLDGENYAVTITPLAANEGGTLNPAQWAPPMRATLSSNEVGDGAEITWTLGEPESTKRVTGRIADVLDKPLSNYQVTALGRWSENAPLTRASSVSTTNAQGEFELYIPTAMENTFDLVARPLDDTSGATALRRTQVEIPDVDPTPLLLVRAGAPTPHQFRVTVQGIETSGGQVPVSGAELVLTTTMTHEGTGTLSEFRITSVTDPEGQSVVDLIPGSTQANRPYTLKVTPPQNSIHMTVYEQALSVGSVGGVLQPVSLARRTPVSGTIISAEGLPVDGASVAIAPNADFRSELDFAGQSHVDELPLAADVSDADGGFVLFVDSTLAGNTATYDIDVIPPASVGAPRWSVESIEADGGNQGVHVGEISLPAAAFVRGIPRDENGPVFGAELRIYELIDDNSVRLREIAHSEEDGWLRAVLPELR